MLDRAEDALDIGQRPDLLDLGRRERIDLHAQRFSYASIVEKFIHPVRRSRKPDIRDLLEAHRLTGFRFQRLVKLDRILVNLTD